MMMMMMMIMMDDDCFCGMVDRSLALFPARTIVRDLHHPESPACRQEDLNLPST